MTMYDMDGFWMDGQVLSGYPLWQPYGRSGPSARWIFSHRARRWRRGGSYGVLPLASLALAGWGFPSTLQTSFSTGDFGRSAEPSFRLLWKWENTMNQWMVSGTLFSGKPVGIFGTRSICLFHSFWHCWHILAQPLFHRFVFFLFCHQRKLFSLHASWRIIFFCDMYTVRICTYM